MIPPLGSTTPSQATRPSQDDRTPYWHLLWCLVLASFFLFEKTLQKACRVFCLFQQQNPRPPVNDFAISLYGRSFTRLPEEPKAQSELEECFCRLKDRVKAAFDRVQKEFKRRFLPPNLVEIARANNPLLEDKLLNLIDKITHIRNFIEKDPQLLKMVSDVWEAFLPHYIAPIDMEKEEEQMKECYSHISFPPRDTENNPLDREYFLQMHILSCEIILENYQRFLQYHPEIEEAIRKKIQLKTGF